MSHVDHFLERFFQPASIAIVGATNNPLKMNYRVLQNLVNLSFKGKIYPVNPKAKEILGIRAFARLQDIPDKIDLVVSAVPALKTIKIVEDCCEVGIKNLVIVTGGFSEGGKEGKILHRDIKALIKENGIRLLGPNTLSPINTSNNLIISYNLINKLNRGNLSFAFQSGFYEPMMNWMFSHLGINKMLDMGNKLDINEVDALKYYSQDPETQVIAMHIESLHGDVHDFLDLIKSVSRKKPIIILKVGRTQAGSIAAASHTGSIAKENDAIFECAIKQAGAIRAQNLEEFFDFAKAFQFLKLPRGKRLAVITLSGGEGVMATDACETYGLKQARLGDQTYQRLKSIFPQWEIPLNPFDAGVCMQIHLSDMMTFFNTLLAILEDDNVDCAIMQMLLWAFTSEKAHPQAAEDSAEYFKALYLKWLSKVKKSGKPFALWCFSMGLPEMEMIEMIEAHNIPVFQSSERAVKAFATLNQYRSQTMQKD
jgi:acyl-CoA synthetase (NDP forming)